MPSSPFNALVTVIEKDGKYIVIEDEFVAEYILLRFKDTVVLEKEEHIQKREIDTEDKE